MFTTTRYILLTARRDWLFIALFITLLFSISISYFLGGTALTEQQETTLAYIAGSARVILMVGLIVFICFHVRRAFENREVELILSRPVSRHGFVFSYWLGFSVLSFFLILPVLLLLSTFPAINFYGLGLWTLSLLLEAFIVAAFALFISLILKSAVSSVLASFGFYIVARMMGFFVLLVTNHAYEFLSSSWLMSQALYIISIIVPRLDLFAKSEWLIYNLKGNDFPLLAMQTLVYIPFLLLMAISDFRRRQF